MTYRFLRLIASFLLCIGFAMSMTGSGMAGPHVVVDVNSSKILSSEDPHKTWYPASLTKLMTAYVVFREIEAGNFDLQSRVIMSNNAAREPASKMYYPVGTYFTLDTALKVLIVKSANDVAVAIGETISGSEEAFVARMNAEAAQLKMTRTRFVNPNGLPGEGQYTTAYDFAVLSAAIRREYPQHAGYFALEGLSSQSKNYNAYNLLLGRFKGADGMKTGFVCSSGFNLVASATRNDRTLVAVILGGESTEDRTRKAADLLWEGFSTLGEDAPLISEFTAPKGAIEPPVDLRPVICSAEAARERRKGRSEDGKRIIDTPYIRAMTRAPHRASIQTDGQLTIAGAGVSRIPLPVTAPARSTALAYSAEPEATEDPFNAVTNETGEAASVEAIPFRKADPDESDENLSDGPRAEVVIKAGRILAKTDDEPSDGPSVPTPVLRSQALR